MLSLSPVLRWDGKGPCRCSPSSPAIAVVAPSTDVPPPPEEVVDDEAVTTDEAEEETVEIPTLPSVEALVVVMVWLSMIGFKKRWGCWDC